MFLFLIILEIFVNGEKFMIPIKVIKINHVMMFLRTLQMIYYILCFQTQYKLSVAI